MQAAQQAWVPRGFCVHGNKYSVVRKWARVLDPAVTTVVLLDQPELLAANSTP